MEIDMNENNWNNPCPKYDCRKDNCKCGLKKIVLPSSLGDDSKDSSISPKNGNYCNAIVVYEANGHIYLYSKEGIPTLITAGGNYDEIIEEIQERLGQVEDGLSQEIIDRIAGDSTLQDEIDAIKNSPDVVDVVANYAALQAYDTSDLGDNDIVRVLQDEQHDGQSTYYRWNITTQSWTYIGAVGDYYTKGQVDDLLDGKQDVLTAGANIAISADNEISATDTTYSDFIGTDGQTAGTAGLVPAPATTDADKFLKSDGTWATAGGGGGGLTVVQTTGTSTTDVMSQDATTKLIYPDIANSPYKIVIGEGAIYGTNKGLVINGVLNTGITGGSIAIGAPDGSDAQVGQNGRADQSVAIGNGASVGRGMCSVAIGTQAFANSGQNAGDNVALGYHAYAGDGTATSTVALGAYAKTTRTGEVNIGTGSNGTGYNNTNYRVLGGVHDGQLPQDAATVAQVNATIDAINAALSTSIPHIGA